MEETHQINLVHKSLKQFQPEDTLYISKTESGYQQIYLCEFIRLEHGNVIAKVIKPSSYVKFQVGQIIRARPSSCFLWGGHQSIINTPYCHWFKNTTDVL